MSVDQQPSPTHDSLLLESADEPTPEIKSDPAPEPAPAAPQPAPAPVTPKLSARLVRTALELGFTQDEINGYEPQDLYNQVRLELDRAAVRRPEPAPAAPVAKEPEDAIDWGTDEDGKVLTEKHYAPAVAKAIRFAHEQGRENKKLREELTQVKQQHEQRQLLGDVEVFDRALSGYSQHFTARSAQEIPQGDPEGDKRALVWANVQALQGGTIKQRTERVLRALYGTAAPAAAPTPAPPAPVAPAPPPVEKMRDPVTGRFLSPQETLDARKQAYANGSVAKPSHRDGHAEEPHGDNRAVAGIQAILRDRGVDSQAHRDDEDDDLPK